MASYCPRWRHELQPPFPLFNQQERGRANTGLCLPLGDTSWKLHASHWLNFGHMVTLSCQERWKTYLFKATLDSVTMGVSISKEERKKVRIDTREKEQATSQGHSIFNLWFYTVRNLENTGVTEVMTSDPGDGCHVNGRTDNRSSVLWLLLLCWDPAAKEIFLKIMYFDCKISQKHREVWCLLSFPQF